MLQAIADNPSYGFFAESIAQQVLPILSTGNLCPPTGCSKNWELGHIRSIHCRGTVIPSAKILQHHRNRSGDMMAAVFPGQPLPPVPPAHGAPLLPPRDQICSVQRSQRRRLCGRTVWAYLQLPALLPPPLAQFLPLLPVAHPPRRLVYPPPLLQIPTGTGAPPAFVGPPTLVGPLPPPQIPSGPPLLLLALPPPYIHQPAPPAYDVASHTTQTRNPTEPAASDVTPPEPPMRTASAPVSDRAQRPLRVRQRLPAPPDSPLNRCKEPQRGPTSRVHHVDSTVIDVPIRAHAQAPTC